MNELTEEVAIRLPWRNYSIIDLKIRSQNFKAAVKNDFQRSSKQQNRRSSWASTKYQPYYSNSFISLHFSTKHSMTDTKIH